ncbi:MAG: hypothetical protein KDA52_24450 [Planctomycetaceae bacterium]|nr:hypothetical protein [Planctomycetaceae bacterium]
MSTLAASTLQWIIILFAVIGVMAVTTWVLNRRRIDVWSQVAKRYGLKYVPPPEGPLVIGDVEGRAVRMEYDEASSDRDLGGVENVRISVGLTGVPPGMTAEGVPGLLGDLAILAEERIEFDAPDFDRDVLVKAEDEQSVRAYWDEHRQRVFLDLIEVAPCDQVLICDSGLRTELRELVSDRDRLQALLDQLLAKAPQLDQHKGEVD